MAHIRVMADFLGKIEPEWCHPLHILLHHDAEAPYLHPVLLHVTLRVRKDLQSHDKQVPQEKPICSAIQR